MDKSIFPIFSPFLTFLCFPIYCVSCFFSVLKFFLIFHVFSFFSSLKNIRTSGRGEHKVWVLQESVHDNFKKNENNNNIKKQLWYIKYMYITTIITMKLIIIVIKDEKWSQ